MTIVRRLILLAIVLFAVLTVVALFPILLFFAFVLSCLSLFIYTKKKPKKKGTVEILPKETTDTKRPFPQNNIEIIVEPKDKKP